MSIATRSGVYTFEDSCCLVKDGQKADLLPSTRTCAGCQRDCRFAWTCRHSRPV